MKPGTKLKSAVCATEVMIIRAGEGELECGGVPMVSDKPETLGEINPAFAEGTAIGKRYTNDAGTIEILCVKPGKGSLSVDGAALHPKDAKPLPASD